MICMTSGLFGPPRPPRDQFRRRNEMFRLRNFVYESRRRNFVYEMAEPRKPSGAIFPMPETRFVEKPLGKLTNIRLQRRIQENRVSSKTVSKTDEISSTAKKLKR